MNNRAFIAGLVAAVGLLGFGLGRLSTKLTATESNSSTTQSGQAIPVITSSDSSGSVNVDPSGGDFHQSTNLQVEPNTGTNIQGALEIAPGQLDDLDIK